MKGTVHTGETDEINWRYAVAGEECIECDKNDQVSHLVETKFNDSVKYRTEPNAIRKTNPPRT